MRAATPRMAIEIRHIVAMLMLLHAVILRFFSATRCQPVFTFFFTLRHDDADDCRCRRLMSYAFQRHYGFTRAAARLLTYAFAMMSAASV